MSLYERMPLTDVFISEFYCRSQSIVPGGLDCPREGATATGRIPYNNRLDMSPCCNGKDKTGLDYSARNLKPPRVAVVGGGITGLAAVHRLRELDAQLDLVLLESSGRVGGVLETVRDDGFVVERSADNFITNVPWALDLCRRIGFEHELINTNDRHRKAMVVRRGRLHDIPAGFLVMAPSRLWPVFTSPILSCRGKLRLACEYILPARNHQEDESLASFATRRLGREAYERLVQPLVGAIYTADPQKLSVNAALPRFRQMECEHGSLIRGARVEAKIRRRQHRSDSGAAYSMFMAPRDGLTCLVEALAAKLPPDTIRLNSPVAGVAAGQNQRWTLSVGGEKAERLDVDGVIVATPASAAAKLVDHVDRDLGNLLQRIPHARCAIVSLGYRRDQIGHAMNGFGFVVPLSEQRQILAGSFSSVKFPGRAPQGYELIRVFVGGACQSELVQLPDEPLRALVTKELEQLLSIRGQPVFDHIHRWPPVMPQYHVGHCELVEQIHAKTAKISGLELAGNWDAGIGIPHCIHSGQQAAEQMVQAVRS